MVKGDTVGRRSELDMSILGSTETFAAQEEQDWTPHRVIASCVRTGGRGSRARGYRATTKTTTTATTKTTLHEAASFFRAA